jgi:transcriptional regulator with GAF, ATPase, and Fis domain
MPAPATGASSATRRRGGACSGRRRRWRRPTRRCCCRRIGDGQGVAARFVHRASSRKDGPFIALNCAALPEQLLEAELFGYERGAFTGAVQSKAGQLEQASGGTLFLDEVGEMSPQVQAKFLRVLQQREFQRLGGTRVLRTDARIVAATNRDLQLAMSRGQVREDLFYRLNVFAIQLPPLRELNKSKAAAALGLTRAQLYVRMKRYGLE